MSVSESRLVVFVFVLVFSFGFLCCSLPLTLYCVKCVVAANEVDKRVDSDGAFSVSFVVGSCRRDQQQSFPNALAGWLVS